MTMMRLLILVPLVALAGCGGGGGTTTTVETPKTDAADISALKDAMTNYQGYMDGVQDFASKCEKKIYDNLDYDAGEQSQMQAYRSCFNRSALPERRNGEKALRQSLNTLLPGFGPKCTEAVQRQLALDEEDFFIDVDDVVPACQAEAAAQ